MTVQARDVPELGRQAWRRLPRRSPARIAVRFSKASTASRARHAAQAPDRGDQHDPLLRMVSIFKASSTLSPEKNLTELRSMYG